MNSISKQLEDYKASIERLYIQEDKTGKEVLASLRDEFQFEATENQLKKKLKQWKFDNKNIRGDIMIRIARAKAKRAVDHKQSSFRVDKKPVSDRKIDRFLERKQIALDDLIDMQSPYDAPSPAFSVFTPETSISSPHPSDGWNTTPVQLSPEIGFDMLSILEPQDPPSPSTTDMVSAIQVPHQTLSAKVLRTTTLPKALAEGSPSEGDQHVIKPNISASSGIGSEQNSPVLIPSEYLSTDVANECQNITRIPSYGAQICESDSSSGGDAQIAPIFPSPVLKSAGDTVKEMEQYLEARKQLIASELEFLRATNRVQEQSRPRSTRPVEKGHLLLEIERLESRERLRVHQVWRSYLAKSGIRGPVDESRTSRIINHNFTWRCSGCGDGGMTDSIEHCPSCYHLRCGDCIARWATAQDI